MVGAVVGGPLYMYRRLSTRPDNAISQAFSASGTGATLDAGARSLLQKPFTELADWVKKQKRADLVAACEHFDAENQSGTTRLLPGPTPA